MSLEQRNPSVGWEPLPLDLEGRCQAWVWYRPASAPNGLVLNLPAALFADANLAARLTVRQLIIAAGLDPARVYCWSLGGITYDAANGYSPYLDQPLPRPDADNPVNSVEVPVWMVPALQPGWIGGPAPAGQEYPSPSYGQQFAAVAGVSSENDQLNLAAIESNWNNILQLEARINSVRKELGSALSRLNSLNRDLSVDERRTADSKDLQDWTDARRWMRDSQATLSRSVKEIDLGITSGAGQRHKFADLYQNQIVPKIPWPGLAQATLDFESYRKTMQNVLAAAQSNLSKAGRDAEQRGNSVLQRIGVKMRAARRK